MDLDGALASRIFPAFLLLGRPDALWLFALSRRSNGDDAIKRDDRALYRAEIVARRSWSRNACAIQVLRTPSAKGIFIGHWTPFLLLKASALTACAVCSPRGNTILSRQYIRPICRVKNVSLVKSEKERIVENYKWSTLPYISVRDRYRLIMDVEETRVSVISNCTNCRFLRKRYNASMVYSGACILYPSRGLDSKG